MEILLAYAQNPVNIASKPDTKTNTTDQNALPFMEILGAFIKKLSPEDDVSSSGQKCEALISMPDQEASGPFAAINIAIQKCLAKAGAAVQPDAKTIAQTQSADQFFNGFSVFFALITGNAQSHKDKNLENGNLKKSMEAISNAFSPLFESEKACASKCCGNAGSVKGLLSVLFGEDEDLTSNITKRTLAGNNKRLDDKFTTVEVSDKSADMILVQFAENIVMS